MSLIFSTIMFLLSVVNQLIFLYSIVVFIACIISFVNPDPYNPVVRFLRSLTEPAFLAIRRHLPFVVMGGLDLSPLVLILGLQFITSVLLPHFSVFIAQVFSSI